MMENLINYDYNKYILKWKSDKHEKYKNKRHTPNNITIYIYFYHKLFCYSKL